MATATSSEHKRSCNNAQVENGDHLETVRFEYNAELHRFEYNAELDLYEPVTTRSEDRGTFGTLLESSAVRAQRAMRFEHNAELDLYEHNAELDLYEPVETWSPEKEEEDRRKLAGKFLLFEITETMHLPRFARQ